MMSAPLKIIIFDGSFKMTAFLNRLAAGLTKRHEVYVMGFNETLEQPVPGIRYIPLGSNQNKRRFVSTTLGNLIKTGRFASIVPTIYQMAKGNKTALQSQNLKIALETIKPDVIHLQWTSVIPPFEDVLQTGSIPVILSQRGFHINVKPFVYPENMAYLRQWYPKFAGFHSVAHSVVRNSAKIWDSPDKIDEVVYTGLDLEAWKFNENYKKSTPLKLLSVGRTHWIKGYDYALRCCRLLKDKNIPFTYDIIGGAGEEELQFLRFDMELEKEVRLLGKVTLPEVQRSMREASLLLVPSLGEGLPNVAVEAMAVGLPVAAFAVDGIPELIDHGKEGWLAPPQDVETLAALVEDFNNLSDTEIEVIRRNGREKVATQFTEAQMVEGMERLYHKVLQNP